MNSKELENLKLLCKEYDNIFLNQDNYDYIVNHLFGKYHISSSDIIESNIKIFGSNVLLAYSLQEGYAGYYQDSICNNELLTIKLEDADRILNLKAFW